MRLPRFNSYWREEAIRVSKGDFEQEGMPPVFKNTTWRIAAEYWTEEKKEGTAVGLDKFPMAPIYELKIDTYIEKDKKIVKASRIAGEYICYPHEKRQEFIKNIPLPIESMAPIFTKEYNPITDAPELFLSFTKTGQGRTPDKVRILNFVRQYGILRLSDRETVFRFHSYPLEAFHYYAREANLTLSLYEAVLNKNHKKIPTILSSWIKELPLGPWFLLKLISIESFLVRWQNKIPGEIFKRAINTGDRFGKIKSIGTENLDIVLLEWIFNNNSDFWELMLLYADKEILFDVACRVVSSVSYYRIGNILLDCTYTLPHENRLKRVEFRPQWYAESLLGHIWLLFFLKVTGQTDQSYRICPVCEKPIENPRKNQTFHPGCRQAYYNRRKREAINLWKNGKSVDFISKDTGIDIDRINGWIRSMEEGK